MAGVPMPVSGSADDPFPGSAGERHLQDLLGTRTRAEAFYRQQMVEILTPRMVEFLARQTMMIVATVNTEGGPDVSVRFGEPGFVSALDEQTLSWPELRGNGVLTTLGNISKNPAVHLMFLDNEHRIGLHVRGDAEIVESPEGPSPDSGRTGRTSERCVVLRVDTSYVHCRKHFPQPDGPIAWGTDDVAAKGGDYFGTKRTPSPWDPAPGAARHRRAR
jgi:hypothetical protein